MTRPARISASLVFLLALATIAVQVPLTYQDYGSIGATLWRLGWFFTLLTNAMVCVSFGLMSIRGQSLSAHWLGGLTLWILIVAIVYHTLLAQLFNETGLRWWTDLGFHTAIPLATALFGGALICIGLVLFAERGKLFGPPVADDHVPD